MPSQLLLGARWTRCGWIPFIRELRQSGIALKFVQAFTALLPGLVEGYLINQISSASHVPTIKWIVLAAVAVVHLLAIIITFQITTPLPSILVDYDDLQNRLNSSEREVATSQRFLDTLDASVTAVQTCLQAIEVRGRSPRADEKPLLQEILEPWANLRTPIFWFEDGASMYNMAIYLFRPSGKLEVAARFVDDRIPRSDRVWSPGEGHIGHCFQHSRTAFSSDTTQAMVTTFIPASKPSDPVYYKAMIITPIMAKGTTFGVLVVNSSQPAQFDQNLHIQIVVLIARLAGDMIVRGWTQGEKYIAQVASKNTGA